MYKYIHIYKNTCSLLWGGKTTSNVFTNPDFLQTSITKTDLISCKANTYFLKTMFMCFLQKQCKRTSSSRRMGTPVAI